jgi:hypothetical protein
MLKAAGNSELLQHGGWKLRSGFHCLHMPSMKKSVCASSAAMDEGKHGV